MTHEDWNPNDHGGCLHCRVVARSNERYIVHCDSLYYSVADTAASAGGWVRLSEHNNITDILPGSRRFTEECFERMTGDDWMLVVRYV